MRADKHFWLKLALDRAERLGVSDLEALRGVERIVQANLDAVRELIQEELAQEAREGRLHIGDEVVMLAANPDAAAREEIERLGFAVEEVINHGDAL